MCLLERTVAFDPAGFIFDPLDDGRFYLLLRRRIGRLNRSSSAQDLSAFARDAAARFTTAAESPVYPQLLDQLFFSIACRSYPKPLGHPQWF